MRNKRVIILAGGVGKRLRPYTISMPKPMVPINNKPILKILIDQLIKHNFDHITISLGYQSHVIIDYINKLRFKAKIDFIYEKIPMGTIGPLTLINDLPEHFVLMNGDILTDLNFAKKFNTHKKSNNLFTINSFLRDQYVDFGVLEANRKNIIVDFVEKPTKNYLVSMGVYFFNKKILKYIPKNKSFGFDNLVTKLLKRKIKINTFVHNGYWLDIGRPDDYEKVHKNFKKIKLI